jgi:hypothetical protein
MGASVTLQIERIVESFAAKSAEIAFHVRMTLEVSIQQTNQSKLLVANAATKRIVSARGAARHFGDRSRLVAEQRVLDAMTSVHKFERIDGAFRQAESLDQVFDRRNERLKRRRGDLSSSGHCIDHLWCARSAAHAGRSAAGRAD